MDLKSRKEDVICLTGVAIPLPELRIGNLD
jgi:hypothetical protein